MGDVTELGAMGPDDAFCESCFLDVGSLDETEPILNEPIIQKIDFTSANLKVSNGEAEWLDVRLPTEYESAHIKGATHMPLIFLRMKMKELDQLKNYIVYCDTARRSSSAAYILSEKGYKTSVLEGGIKDVPPDTLEGNSIEP